MLNERTFSEIFNEVHHDEKIENIIPTWESSLEPAWMAQLMAEVKLTTRGTPQYSKYRLAKPGSAQFSQRVPHVMDSLQLAAFEVFNQYLLQPLDRCFFKQELKSAYRKALLKTHPDQGGTAETFQQVKKSYEILVVFVTK